MKPKTFNQLVEANHFGYQYITSSYKPKKAIESKAKIVLWHSGKITTNQEFLDRCKSINGRPATFDEALQYALDNPDEQKKNPLVTYDLEQLCCLCLRFGVDERRLYVDEDLPDNYWHDYVRFLVVPAPVSVPASSSSLGDSELTGSLELGTLTLTINGNSYKYKQVEN